MWFLSFGTGLILFYSCLNQDKDKVEIRKHSKELVDTIAYFDNDSIMLVGYLRNGKRDSLWNFYYDNGVLFEQLLYWSNGIPFGNRYLYYPNGKLKSYLFHSLEGVVFKQEFDSFGNNVFEDGITALFLFNRDTLNQGEKFNSTVYFASGKTGKITGKVIKRNPVLNDSISFTLSQDDSYNKSFFYETELLDRGYYEIIFIYEIDNINGSFIQDTLRQAIYVK